MSVGETLRKAREAKGLTLEDIKNSTQMLTRQIAEMEEDDFSSFLAPIYAKGFIRLYARAVGIDPEPLVKEFMANPPKTGGSAAPVKVLAGDAPQPAPAAPKADEPKAVAETPAAEPEPETEPDLFSLAAKPAAAPMPKPVEKPVVASNLTDAPRKVVSSAPFEFEKRATAAQQPEKRVAAVEPGAPAPAPVLPVRGEGTRVLARPEFVPPPATKKLPEPESIASRAAAPASGRPIAPLPLPLEGDPFRFPGPPPMASAPEPAEEVAEIAKAVAAPPKKVPASAPAPAPVRAIPVRPVRPLVPAHAEEEILAAGAPAHQPAPAPAREESLFAAKPKAKVRRAERAPRPDAPNVVRVFLSNVAAAWRTKRGFRTAVWSCAGVAAAAIVAVLGVAAFGGSSEGGAEPAAPTSVEVTEPVEVSKPAPEQEAAPVDPPEPIAKVFPPPASWAK